MVRGDPIDGFPVTLAPVVPASLQCPFSLSFDLLQPLDKRLVGGHCGLDHVFGHLEFVAANFLEQLDADFPQALAGPIAVSLWFIGRNPSTYGINPVLGVLFSNFRDSLAAVSFVISQKVSIEFCRQLVAQTWLVSFWFFHRRCFP